MKRNYIVMITLITISTIILSILFFSYFTSNVFSKQNDRSKGELSNVLIVADITSGNAPLTVSFKPLLQDFGDDVQYSWDFGDGERSDETAPIYTYNVEGGYNCKLTVKDDTSESSDEVLITVRENNPPIIKIIVDKTSGNRPLTINFDVDGFDTDGEIVSYEWEIKYPPFFSYQKISNHEERNFSERFLRSGFYEVKLTVTDDAGKIATDYIKIQTLGHKIELLVGTSLYYIGIFDTIFQIYNNFVGKNSVNTPQTFFEKIASFLEVNR